jgi:hypothetical protein
MGNYSLIADMQIKLSTGQIKSAIDYSSEANERKTEQR